jgi:hypothetical protein
LLEPPAAKAASCRTLYGTAEAVPYKPPELKPRELELPELELPELEAPELKPSELKLPEPNRQQSLQFLAL